MVAAVPDSETLSQTNSTLTGKTVSFLVTVAKAKIKKDGK